MNNSINKKVGRAAAWSSVTELMAKLISPIVNIFLARLLLPEAFGIVATITMVTSFAEVFTDAGFQKYIIQHEFKDENELNESTNVAFWTNLGISIFACLVIFVFRDRIAILVGNSGLGISISIASLLIVFHAFSSIQMARYKRELDFKTLFFVRIGTSLIPLVITIPLAIVLRNYWALIIGNFATQGFNAFVLTVKSKWKIKFFYNFSLFKQMFSFSVWTLLESISIWLTSNIDIFLISKYLDEHYLGLYKTSMATINSYMGLITAALTPVLFSTLSRYQNDDKQFKSTYYTFQKLTSVLVVPMGIGIFIFSDLVTLILLGENWMEASGFIGWWGLTSAFTIIFSHFSSEVIRSKGKPLISFIIQVIHILVLMPVLIMFKDSGFRTLYIVRSLLRVELILSAIIVLCVIFKFNLRKIFVNIIPAMFSAIIMAVVGYCVRGIFDNIIWQFASIFICVIVYFVILLGCFPKLRRELLETEYAKKIVKIFNRR
ncbi:MAG: lipopolysaccharide biosynthesis protein [Clostridia bacterium]|nr:lipopolysaccharide biosynthesis protein [Clostridia bacterium]